MKVSKGQSQPEIVSAAFLILYMLLGLRPFLCEAMETYGPAVMPATLWPPCPWRKRTPTGSLVAVLARGARLQCLRDPAFSVEHRWPVIKRKMEPLTWRDASSHICEGQRQCKHCSGNCQIGLGDEPVQSTAAEGASRMASFPAIFGTMYSEFIILARGLSAPTTLALNWESDNPTGCQDWSLPRFCRVSQQTPCRMEVDGFSGIGPRKSYFDQKYQVVGVLKEYEGDLGRALLCRDQQD